MTALVLAPGTRTGYEHAATAGVDRAIRVSTAIAVLAVAGVAAYAARHRLPVPAWRQVAGPQLGQDPGHVGPDRGLAGHQFRSDLGWCPSQLFWLATIFVRYFGRIWLWRT